MNAKQTNGAGSTADKRLEPALAAARRLIVHAGSISFFVNLLMLTGPLYMLQIYDRVLSSRSQETLLALTGLVLALFAAMAVLDFARGALLARAGSAIDDELKETTFDMSMDAGRLGLANADQPLKDLRTVRSFVASPALTAVLDAPWTPIFLGVVFLMHWLLGVVALVGLIVLLSLAITNEHWSRKSNASAQTGVLVADKLALAAQRNAAAADAMGMRANLRRRWLTISDGAFSNALTATDRIGGLTAATKATRLFLQSAILGAGALLAIAGAVTPGVMIAASIITGRALAPIEIVTGQWRNFALASSAYQRLKRFIAGAEAPPERMALPAPTGAITARQLVCQPPNAAKPILRGVSFELAKGESLGVVGPSAAGKTSLTRALVGVLPLRAGEIRLDQANIDHWSRDALGAHLGYLPQEVELFAGTAAENIARFRPDAEPDAVIAAAKAAGAHEMILGFPDGYDTEIGERGQLLSAGQRQRLGLARALFGDPKLVVLDEPNANLDADGDAALENALRTLKAQGVTTIIVAHRPSAIATVDKILMLVDGEARGFGPREEILRQITPKQVTSIKSRQDELRSQEARRRAQSGAE